MVKRHGADTYIFAINMEKKAATAKLAMPSAVGDVAIVLGEDRTVTLDSGALEDQFGPYAVHLYKIAGK
jgi:hypothetical protein